MGGMVSPNSDADASAPEAAAPPPRTLRPILLWTAAILAALALAWFVGAVAAIWQTRRVVAETRDRHLGRDQALRMLGPPTKAARRLDRYLRLTQAVRIDTNEDYLRYEAVELLGGCGQPAVAALAERTTQDYDHMTRKIAGFELQDMANQTADQDARAAAAKALKKIRGEEPPK